MECPKCGTGKLLAKRKVKGRDLEIDLCETCMGMWFDTNELAAVLEVTPAPLTIPTDAKEQGRLCPRCRNPLSAFCYPRTMIIVDACRSCKGIWLDRGELKEMQGIRRTLEELQKRQPRIVCPKCGLEQPASVDCARCGIVFSKYESAARRSQEDQGPETRRSVAKSPENLKERVLGYINSTMDSLWGSIVGGGG